MHTYYYWTRERVPKRYERCSCSCCWGCCCYQIFKVLKVFDFVTQQPAYLYRLISKELWILEQSSLLISYHQPSRSLRSSSQSTAITIIVVYTNFFYIKTMY